jgi:hypothetical protein
VYHEKDIRNRDVYMEYQKSIHRNLDHHVITTKLIQNDIAKDYLLLDNVYPNVQVSMEINKEGYHINMKEASQGNNLHEKMRSSINIFDKV